MTVVIDVGCARYGGDHSVERLIDMFRPDMLIGYDPNPGTNTYPHPGPPPGTAVYLREEAAWVFDGEVGFVADGLNGWVSDDVLAGKVPCVDLARVIHELPWGDVILKLDCEKSEYPLLWHLVQQGAAGRLRKLLVEWHCLTCGRGGWGNHRDGCDDRLTAPTRRKVEAALAIDVEEWSW